MHKRLKTFTLTLTACYAPCSGLVDFTTAMNIQSYTNPCIHKAIAHDQALAFMKFLEVLYDKQKPTFATPKKGRPLIPKIIHQIWLGPSAPPSLFSKWQHSIKQLHPTWEYKLWTDKELANFPFYNKTLYDASKNYGERSDIARYEILHRYGGLYLDVDFECIKPFDALHYQYEFYTGILPLDNRSILANGLLASTPQHPIVRECITSLSKDRHYKTILQRTGPQHFDQAFWRVAKAYRGPIIALPASFFFPLTQTQSQQPYDTHDFIKPETMVIHHWTGTWTTPHAKVGKKKGT